MRILVTGAKGFIGKNLIAELRNQNYTEIYEYDRDTKEDLLIDYCEKCDFIYHLAGINRPKDEAEFMEGNFGFTSLLLSLLKKTGNKCPIMISSTIQATLDNSYGKSKKAAEDLFFSYGREVGSDIFIYRFPNVFGKWCRPNYNSAVATFCHNITRDLEIKVNDRSTELTLLYIDDLIHEMLGLLNGTVHRDSEGYCYVPVDHKITLGELVDNLYSFKEGRSTLQLPDVTHDSFTKKLYSTYLSYLPTDQFSYPLKMNYDIRGSFTEILKTPDRGQISVNISKPGIVKGNHWHHTKIEKFVVVSGTGLLRLRELMTDEIIEYPVSGDKMVVVDIPVGYTHEIINIGNEDLVTLIWCNECFSKEKPDTYNEKVALENE